MAVQREIHPNARVWVHYSLQAVGFLGVAPDVIGTFPPALPTTPFLLLTVARFMHSSPRFYHWLAGHSWFGPWTRDYLNGEDIPLRGKVYAIGLMWASIALSCYLIRYPWVRGFMLTNAVLISIYILRQKTHPPYDA